MIKVETIEKNAQRNAAETRKNNEEVLKTGDTKAVKTNPWLIIGICLATAAGIWYFFLRKKDEVNNAGIPD
jgi:hypothetical protein